MSIRRRANGASYAVQPALALEHADVHWNALPLTVQSDVLARWCELLQAVMIAAPAASDAVTVEDAG